MSRGSMGLDERLNRLLAKNHPPEHPVLAELRSDRQDARPRTCRSRRSRGISSPSWSRLIGAKNALEVGTFTGYSALAVALALPKGGRLVACDVSEAWTSDRAALLEKAGVARKIDLRLGPASRR